MHNYDNHFCEGFIQIQPVVFELKRGQDCQTDGWKDGRTVRLVCAARWVHKESCHEEPIYIVIK